MMRFLALSLLCQPRGICCALSPSSYSAPSLPKFPIATSSGELSKPASPAGSLPTPPGPEFLGHLEAAMGF